LKSLSEPLTINAQKGAKSLGDRNLKHPTDITNLPHRSPKSLEIPHPKITKRLQKDYKFVMLEHDFKEDYRKITNL